MLKNYFKITIRNFYRNRISTVINLLGLTVGVSTCMIVFLLINYEMSFDLFHSKADRIYRVVRESENASGKEYSGAVPYPMGEALMNDFPELEAITQVFGPTDYQIELGDKKWEQQDVLFADSSFFDVFDYSLIAGNKMEALKQPNRAIITRSLARQHFGQGRAIGSIIRLNNQEDVEVVGIMEDPPPNSHLTFSIITSFQTLSRDFVGGFEIKNWGTVIGVMNYVVLPKSMSHKNFDHHLKEIPVKYFEAGQQNKDQFHLQPLHEIHFDKKYAGSNGGNAIDISLIWILGCIGVFIISIACINFINLSTAVAIKKSKEVGIRKVLGAYRGQLILQFLSEAFLLTIFSVLLSLGIVERILPLVNGFIDVSLHLNLINDFPFLIFLLAIILFVGTLSGLYPALVLSSYSPQEALKSRITDGKGSSLFLRRGLVAFQFVIAQVLIIGTIVIASQMKFFNKKPLGFDKDQIITVGLGDNDPEKLATFKNEILASNQVTSLSYAVGVPTSENSIGTNFKVEGLEDDMSIRLKAVDFDYLKTFDLKMVAGQWFTSEQNGEESYELIINETAVRKMGISNPEKALGRVLQLGLNDIKAPVVGVVKDFHMQSLHKEIEPMFMIQTPRLFFEAGIKISDKNIPETLAYIEEKWNIIFPDYLFEYEFLDASLAKNYKAEQSVYSLLKVLSGIAIFIGCLGLIGLVSFLVTQKSKEVGVRKVLGASVTGIFFLFSKDYLKLIVVAFLIAAPLSWWIMGEWLATFAYKIEMTPWFLVAGVAINCFIAILTVGFQSIKAALANPVDSLRDE